MTLIEVANGGIEQLETQLAATKTQLHDARVSLIAMCVLCVVMFFALILRNRR